MRVIRVAEVLDVIEHHTGAMGWIVFGLGVVFGIGLARIVMALAGIQ